MPLVATRITCLLLYRCAQQHIGCWFTWKIIKSINFHLSHVHTLRCQRCRIIQIINKADFVVGLLPFAHFALTEQIRWCCFFSSSSFSHFSICVMNAKWKNAKTLHKTWFSVCLGFHRNYYVLHWVRLSHSNGPTKLNWNICILRLQGVNEISVVYDITCIGNKNQMTSTIERRWKNSSCMRRKTPQNVMKIWFSNDY